MYIYLIKDTQSNLYKIGISKNPATRIKNLQTGNGNKLVLKKQYYSEIARKIEGSLHRLYSHKRQISEWFKLNETEIAEFESQCELTEKNIKLTTTHY